MSQKIKKIIDYDFILYISDIPWQDIKQRQHHITEQLSKYNKTIFFCCNSITKFTIKKFSTNVIIKQLFLLPFTRYLLIKKINFFISLLYLKFFLKNKKFILILSHPTQKIFLNLNYQFLIYDYVDSVSEYKIVSKISNILKNYENNILERANYIFAPSNKILNNLKTLFDKKVLFFPNSVNLEDFYINKEYDIPKDILNLKNKKIIGFYGAINELFDLNLIKFVAEKEPNIYFIIIGPIFIKINNLPSNIIFLGKKNYSDLINYLSNINLWIIPFVQSQFTEIFNPVKVYEYLASGRYVVTTYLPELQFMNKYISITKNYNDFYNEIIKNIDRNNISEYNNLEKLLNNNTWENILKKNLKKMNLL